MSSDSPAEIEVEIQDLQELIDLDHDQIEDLVRFVLIRNDHGGRIGLCFVDDEAIAALHQQFMDDPTPTDVITFPLEPIVDGILDGEIVVSTETALREASRHQMGTGDEVRLYIVHGLLHLLGHDDQDEPGEKAMNRLQLTLLDRWKAIRGLLGD